MKKIKDLIYDYNDVFLALLIVIIAAAVIGWRVMDIMDYPAYAKAHSESSSHSGDVDFSDVDLNQKEIEDFNENPDEINTDVDYDSDEEPDDGQETGEGGEADGNGQQGENPDQGDTATEGSEPAQPQTPAGNVTAREYKITIPENTYGTGVGKILAEAGAIDKKEAFVDKLIEMKLENRIQPGTFTIPKGSTIEDIVKIVTKTNN